MADGNIQVAARRAPGRPRKARGASNTSDAADARWTVRGVPLNVRGIATKAADAKGMTVGDWLAEAVVAYSRSANSGVSADGNSVTADGGTNLPAIPLPAELTGLLESIQSRLDRIEGERKKPLMDRIFGRRG